MPVIGCECPVCSSGDTKDKRLRTSAHLQIHDLSLIIDSGPDFRYQVLRAGIKKLDAILYTHQHRDHIAGLDDVRSYNFLQKSAMPIYCTDLVIEQIRREFHYVFESKYPGIPQLEINRIDSAPFCIQDVEVIPIEVIHHKLPVLGFRIADFTYITDANIIPEKEIEKLKGSKFLVLNALQKDEHLSHFTLDEALKVIERVGPKRAYLTHISHKMGRHEDVSKELPDNVLLAFDGLRATF